MGVLSFVSGLYTPSFFVFFLLIIYLFGVSLFALESRSCFLMYCSIEGGGSAEEERALWLIRPSIEDRGAYGWDETLFAKRRFCMG
jgi:hypothetical protein